MNMERREIEEYRDHLDLQGNLDSKELLENQEWLDHLGNKEMLDNLVLRVI